MAGHSQFANIKHRKDRQDSKRAKEFAKLARKIIVAAKQGMPDPSMNAALRDAMAAARAVNMPKDKIQNAINTATGANDSDNYEEIRYEGYAPGGIALVIEALTDNRNRTAGEIRSAFTKAGGALGETGSVGFMFEHVGLIQYPKETASADAMFEAGVEAGAENVESSEHGHEIICSTESFREVRDALAEKFGDAETARLSWKPKDLIAINDVEQAAKLLKLIDALEDNDDVQCVEGNYRIPDEVAEKL